MKSDYETALDMMTEIIGQMRRMPEPKDDGLGSESALKEQVRKLVDDKRKLTQNLDHVIEENNDLELTIGRLKAELEWAENEIVKPRGLIESDERTSTEASKEIDRLTAKVKTLDEENDRLFNENSDLRGKLEDAEAKIKELNDALAIYRVPTPRACPFCGGMPDVVAINKERWVVACHSDTCDVNPETDFYDTIEAAISAWNRRVGGLTCDWR